jgi:hypothetical protein|nr:MAG TPA: DnaD like replication protein [Caudoviricetes sp.]
MSTKPKRTDMNYILQSRELDNQQFINPLPAGQYMLLRALIAIHNNCGWLEEITIALATLETFSGLSRAGVQKARRALVNKGYIEFKSNGTKAGSYKIFKIYEENSSMSGTTNRYSEVASSTTTSTQESKLNVNDGMLENGDMTGNIEVDKNTSTQVVTGECKRDDIASVSSSNESSTTSSTPLTKLNKTKLNETKYMMSGSTNTSESSDSSCEQSKDIFDFYKENFGEPSKIVAQDLVKMSKKFGDELVIEALKQAGFYNKQYGYAKTILNRWVNEGVDSLEKVEAEQAKFVKTSEKKVNSYPRTGRVATVPEWVNNPNETKETKLSPEEEQKLRDQLNALRSVAK